MNVAVHSQLSALSVHPANPSQQIGRITRILCQPPSPLFSRISGLFAKSSYLAHSTVLTRLVIFFAINILRTLAPFFASLSFLSVFFSGKSELFAKKQGVGVPPGAMGGDFCCARGHSRKHIDESVAYVKQGKKNNFE